MNITNKITIAAGFIFGFLLITSILASGKHEAYYVQQEAAATSITYYCLYADVNWRSDPRIFCSEDISKVLMLYFGFKAQTDIKPDFKESQKKSEFK